MVATPQDILNQIEKIKEETNQEIADRVEKIVWEVIEDMHSSYDLVLSSFDVDPKTITRAKTTVEDYTGNHYD